MAKSFEEIEELFYYLEGSFKDGYEGIYEFMHAIKELCEENKRLRKKIKIKPPSKPNVPSIGVKGRVYNYNFTKQKLISFLQLYVQTFNKVPTQKSWDLKRKKCMPSANVFKFRFGSWSSAIKAAGFEPYKQGRNG